MIEHGMGIRRCVHCIRETYTVNPSCINTVYSQPEIAIKSGQKTAHLELKKPLLPTHSHLKAYEELHFVVMLLVCCDGSCISLI